MKANVPVVVIFIVLILVNILILASALPSAIRKLQTDNLKSSDSPASSDEALPPGIIFDYLFCMYLHG